MARGDLWSYIWWGLAPLGTYKVCDSHVLLGEGGFCTRGNFLQNELILVATNAEFDQCIPLILRQKVFVHPLDNLLDYALGKNPSVGGLQQITILIHRAVVN